ncbi:MAG: DNA-processing protein DprA [Acutalibacteraceae bacterium]|nr:DNA-processing protein DprA [Acutalibacteraceae bacterium]
MEDTKKYWVWLQSCIGYGSPKINTVLRFYPSIVDFYNGGEMEWRLCGCFTKKEFENLCTHTLEQAEKVIDKCNALGYTILTPDMSTYPQLLKEIYDPPAVLYVDGQLPDVDNTLSIAMVGTRNATTSGKKLSYSIAFDLANSGVNVISGGALGIDSSAHSGALMAGGKTVCVLGCGINSNYLMSNASMRAQIAKTGAVVSEYPPDYQATKYTFPKRNRIISALSQGVLVVEAGEKSGALITASTALEQNKDIFAIPGDVTNAVAFGTNKLIKQGAKPITTAGDIIEEYTNKYSLILSEPLPISEISDNIINSIPSGRKRPISVNDINSKKSVGILNTKNGTTINNSINNKVNVKEKKLLTDVSDDAKIIYDIIFESDLTVDDIIIKTKLPVNKVMQAVTELEIEEIITRKSGGVISAL